MAHTIYDAGFPCQMPDQATAALAAAVALEDIIRLDANETGAFFASDGSLVIRKTGSGNHVQFVGPELAGTIGTVFTHNHPAGGSFSLQDVEAAIESDLTEVRAVGPTLRYRMWPKVAWPSRQMLYAEVKALYPGVLPLVGHMVASRAVHPQYAQLEAEHQLWVRVASALGLVYRRERAWP